MRNSLEVNESLVNAKHLLPAQPERVRSERVEVDRDAQVETAVLGSVRRYVLSQQRRLEAKPHVLPRIQQKKHNRSPPPPISGHLSAYMLYAIYI